MKLQQAYISEAVAIGDWDIIGYKGPGDNSSKKSVTTNFTYTDEGASCSNNTVSISTANKGWQAENKAKLNDCAAGSTWDVSTSGTAGDTDATFKSTVTGTGCKELTASFETIGK